VIENDRRLWKGSRKVDELWELRVIEPRIERKLERCQVGKPLTECSAPEQSARRIGVAITDLLARAPAGGVADAAKAATPGRDVRFQHGLDPIAECQVGEADDAGAEVRGPASYGGSPCGDTVDEFGFADRT